VQFIGGREALCKLLHFLVKSPSTTLVRSPHTTFVPIATTTRFPVNKPCDEKGKTGEIANSQAIPRAPIAVSFSRQCLLSRDYFTNPTFLSTRRTFFGEIASLLATRETFFPSRCHTLGITISANSSVTC